MNRHAEAIDAYKAALDLKPDLAALHNNIGYNLNLLDRHVEAVDAYRRAIKIKPDFGEALLNLAGSLAAVGDTTAAAKAAEDAPRPPGSPR
jgi:tetratricopeptide (TPR) repeat protein